MLSVQNYFSFITNSVYSINLMTSQTSNTAKYKMSVLHSFIYELWEQSRSRSQVDV